MLSECGKTRKVEINLVLEDIVSLNCIHYEGCMGTYLDWSGPPPMQVLPPQVIVKPGVISGVRLDWFLLALNAKRDLFTFA